MDQDNDKRINFRQFSIIIIQADDRLANKIQKYKQRLYKLDKDIDFLNDKLNTAKRKEK